MALARVHLGAGSQNPVPHPEPIGGFGGSPDASSGFGFGNRKGCRTTSGLPPRAGSGACSLLLGYERAPTTGLRSWRRARRQSGRYSGVRARRWQVEPGNVLGEVSEQFLTAWPEPVSPLRSASLAGVTALARPSCGVPYLLRYFHTPLNVQTPTNAGSEVRSLLFRYERAPSVTGRARPIRGTERYLARRRASSPSHSTAWDRAASAPSESPSACRISAISRHPSASG